MKVSKLVADYTMRFAIPIAFAFWYWDPRSDEDIRKDVEKTIRPDDDRRRKRQAKFKELLLQQDATEDTKQQLDDITAFSKPRGK